MKPILPFLTAILLASLDVLHAVDSSAGLTARELRCEYQDRPLAIVRSGLCGCYRIMKSELS
jgi:hypothetical protein